MNSARELQWCRVQQQQASIIDITARAHTESDLKSSACSRPVLHHQFIQVLRSY